MLNELSGMSEFDHLGLSSDHRQLMRVASGCAKRIFLAPMDKGLSGSVLWQARWEMPGSRLSKLHVFKIGKRSKLIREENAVINVASAIEIGFPLMKLFSVESIEPVLLRQEFTGDLEGPTISLRLYLQDNQRCPDASAAVQIIQDLYFKRMRDWHPLQGSNVLHTEETSTLSEALPILAKKIDLSRGASQIGRTALDRSLARRYKTSIDSLSKAVDAVRNMPLNLTIGPVHGDLHAQNVNVDSNGNLHLIDFASTGYAWRAIDFIVMECALKFATTPSNATPEDLLELEATIEEFWCNPNPNSCSCMRDCFYGTELEKVSAAVCAVRTCAADLKAIADIRLYRIGLVYFTAAMATIESLINRIFLFHSLAHQLLLLDLL